MHTCMHNVITSTIQVTFSFEEKVNIAVQISQALVYMHSCKPIVHLDLKPENVLVRIYLLHVGSISIFFCRLNARPTMST